MAFKDFSAILNTHLVVFFGDWFGFESLADHSSVILVLLTVTHVCSVVMMIYQPVYTSCFGYFGALTLIEMIAFFLWSMTLLVIFFCHLTKTPIQKVVKYILCLHFAGVIWYPVLPSYWSKCIHAIHIPSFFSCTPPIVFNYAPLYLNGCLGDDSNCHNVYLFSLIKIMIWSASMGMAYSLYVLIMGKLEEYMLSKYDDEIVPRAGRSARNRIGQAASMSLISLSDSLCRYYLHSRSESLRRPRMNTSNSSSDEQIPHMAANSVMEPEMITLVRRENNAAGQPFEFEVHPKPCESDV